MKIEQLKSIFLDAHTCNLHVNTALNLANVNTGKELTCIFDYANELNLSDHDKFTFIDAIYYMHNIGLKSLNIK